MRLFFAIELPDALRREVAARGRALGDRVRPVRADGVHLTVRFVGEVAPDRVPDLIAAAHGAIAGPPFELALRGGGVFPARGAPRVLWVGVDGDGARLAELAGALDRALVPFGVEARDRFVPHVTLGRARGTVPAAAVAAVRAIGDLGRVEVTEVVLFRSVLGADGAQHEPVERFPLAPGRRSPGCAT